MDTAASQSVLVTGAGGFIGRRLVRCLIEGGVRVHCLVRSPAPTGGPLFDGAHIIRGDVTDAEIVAGALAESKARTVFHLAGLVRARRHAEFMRVNAGGVEVVAAACAARQSPPVLVVVSSLAAAGPCGAGRVRVEEETPAPVSNYGRSKLAGERAAAAYAGSVPICVVRPPIVFGAGDRAMRQMFRPIARWGVHLVPGRRGAEHRLSLIHVDDLVDGLLLAAAKGERLQPDGPQGKGIYFMAGEDLPSFAELGRLIGAALGQTPPRVVRVPAWVLRLMGVGADLATRVGRQPGWINGDKMTEALAGSWACSSAKARSQLGWSAGARGALADRLRETAEGYRSAGWL